MTKSKFVGNIMTFSQEKVICDVKVLGHYVIGPKETFVLRVVDSESHPGIIKSGQIFEVTRKVSGSDHNWKLED